MSHPYSKYLSKIRASESGGNDNAHNPHGASGRYQFLPSTWTNMGYNIKDIYNPQLQEEAAYILTSQNANYLKKRLGIEPTDADLYGAHFLGPAGYSHLYQTPNNAPISTVMSPLAIAHNPFVKGKTVGFVKNWLAKKMNQPGVEDYDMESYEPVYTPITPEQQAALDAYVAQATAMTQEKIAKETYKSELAKQELEQKQREHNFLNELNATFKNAKDKQELSQAQPQGDGSEYTLAQVQRPTLQALPTPMIEYNDGGTIEPLEKLKEMLKNKGFDYKQTSGVRLGAKTKQGRKSRHSSGEAIDLVFPKLGKDSYNAILNDPEIARFMLDNNLTAIDEYDEDTLKQTGGTGGHLHIGLDRGTSLSDKFRKDANLLYGDTESSEPVYNPITPEQQGALDAYVAQATAMTQERIEKENYKSELAKQELEQKQREYYFLNELNATFKNAKDKQEMSQVQQLQGDGSEYMLAQVQKPTLKTIQTPMIEYNKGGFARKTWQDGGVISFLSNLGDDIVEFFFDEKKVKPIKKSVKKDNNKTLNIVDPRKTMMTTNQSLRPNSDLVGGKYDSYHLDKLIQEAKRQGLSKKDILNLSAMGFQETKWGREDENIGHVIGDWGGNDGYSDFVNAYKAKMKEADRLGITDPIMRLQVYNGTGTITPETEKQYHGFKMQKIYGVPIPKAGISMKKNPLYGKQITDIRDNVLAKNPEYVKYIDSIYKAPVPLNGYAMGGFFTEDKEIAEGGNIVNGDPTSNIKSWFAQQIQSPVYRRNLEKSGYKDVDAEIAKRLSNIDKTKYTVDESRRGTYYNPGSRYIHHAPLKDIENWGGNAPESEYILAHEFGHSGVAKGPNTRLNKYDIEQLGLRNKNKKSYPWENYADLKAAQYEAAKLGIYNPGTDEFTQEHLDKLKKNGNINRIFENYSDKDIIWLTNNLAQADNKYESNISKKGLQTQVNFNNEKEV